MPQITKVSLFIAYALQLGYFLGANKAFAVSTTFFTAKPSRLKPIPKTIRGIPKSKPRGSDVTKDSIPNATPTIPKTMTV